MKITAPLALLSLTTLLPLLPSATLSVNACTIVDATTQVAIRGSRTPAQQENNITTESDDNCFNNTVVGNTTQLGISAGQVRQSNQGEYVVGGGDVNNTGLTTPTIIVTPETQVDIYSPAHDPEFLNHLRP
ncbi:MAG: hypothetical protein QNJ53_02700 [Pleurocapsa sp. MO_192.B19]|nr:hypothetical protein [Pleurocapsa sp. MO_192.B19]